MNNSGDYITILFYFILFYNNNYSTTIIIIVYNGSMRMHMWGYMWLLGFSLSSSVVVHVEYIIKYGLC